MGLDAVTRKPVCRTHRWGSCSVDGCESPAGGLDKVTRLPLCAPHWFNGADYVKGDGARPYDQLYLIHHRELQAIKIGIAVEGAGRLNSHLQNGWTVVKTWELDDPRRIEQLIVREWREAGIPVGALPHHMPQAGHTETAPSSLVDVTTVIGRVAELLSSGS
jgi:hypothetical protein